MELTSENVEKVLADCLFKEGEPTDNAIIAEGVVNKFGFHPDRIAKNKESIRDLLSQLPDQFEESKGGGWSFLQACVRKDEAQWGEHRNIEQLLCLGIACGLARIQFPRDIWSIFPGGVPYFCISTVEPAQGMIPCDGRVVSKNHLPKLAGYIEEAKDTSERYL